MIYQNIDQLLANNTDTTIIFCVANLPVIDFLENLIISASKLGIKIVVFSLDEQMANILDKKYDLEIVIHKIESTVDSNKCSEFGSRGFGNIIFERFFIARYLLMNNRSVIYTDVDIVFCKDFREDMDKYLKEYDFICQTEWLPKRKKQSRGCTGFFGMKPNQGLIKFFGEKSMRKKKFQKFTTNQKFINKYFNGFQDSTICKTKLLEKEDYPNGVCYKRISSVRKKCYIVHFNCELGMDRKRNFMKKYKKYFLNN